MSPSHIHVNRVYQRENVISTNTGSHGYASTENQTYLEYDLATMNDDANQENHVERIGGSDVSSEQYVHLNPALPPRVDACTSVTETVDKNRKKMSILKILSKRNRTRDKGNSFDYITVVHSKASSSSDSKAETDNCLENETH
jgi:hypothetical protein